MDLKWNSHETFHLLTIVGWSVAYSDVCQAFGICSRGAIGSPPWAAIYDGTHHSLSLAQTPKFDQVILQTFGYILRLYPLHPEFKSFAPDGKPCDANTRGLLQRMNVIAGQPRYVGKETDRKWDQGGDLSLLQFKPAQFDELGNMAKADPALTERIAAMGIKVVSSKANVDRNTIRKILRGLSVRRATMLRIVAMLPEEQ